ncbi:hypothetical protein [Streptomyces sp. NPDC008001]|uniref:hypothetical protein n=1 Tax=Streptomyces sp. NPDC008001 TaxID=3364804 RepID=UPI0036EEC07C
MNQHAAAGTRSSPLTGLRRTAAAFLTALTVAGSALAATCTTTVTVTATTTAGGGAEDQAQCAPASAPLHAVAARPVHR